MKSREKDKVTPLNYETKKLMYPRSSEQVPFWFTFPLLSTQFDFVISEASTKVSNSESSSLKVVDDVSNLETKDKLRISKLIS